jgi:hypothetical protein
MLYTEGGESRKSVSILFSKLQLNLYVKKIFDFKIKFFANLICIYQHNSLILYY